MASSIIQTTRSCEQRLKKAIYRRRSISSSSFGWSTACFSYSGLRRGISFTRQRQMTVYVPYTQRAMRYHDYASVHFDVATTTITRICGAGFKSRLACWLGEPRDWLCRHSGGSFVKISVRTSTGRLSRMCTCWKPCECFRSLRHHPERVFRASTTGTWIPRNSDLCTRAYSSFIPP